MYPENRHLTMNGFLSSRLSCYSLIWMFHNRFLNCNVSIFHEGCFLFVYNGVFSSNEQVLNKVIRATEVVTVYRRGASNVLNEVFPLNPESSYSLILLYIMFGQFSTLCIILNKYLCHNTCKYSGLWLKFAKLCRSKIIRIGSK